MALLTRAFLALIFAIALGFYKAYLHDAIVIIAGIGRVVQPLEDFPKYRCERVRHPLLESCEDLWLDNANRKLYAACSNPAARKAWSPGGSMYDLAALDATSGWDHISVLDIDQPGADGLYGLRTLDFHGGGANNQRLYLHGFDVRPIDNGRRLRFWLVNHRLPVDTVTGKRLLDATKIGANSTIEVYDLDLRHSEESNRLEHVKTIVSDAIISPNNLVVVDDERGGFLVTNDHGTKAGPLRDLKAFLGDGSIAYCSTNTGECHLATTDNCFLPNGITRDPSSGRVYVAHSSKGAVSVYHLTEDNRLVQNEEIPLSIVVDNLSIDPEGNVFVGAFPSSIQLHKAFNDPYHKTAPSAVLMIRKKDGEQSLPGEEYEVIKIIEDAEGRVLPTTTTAIHDPISGRLFLGGVTSPFIGVCERLE
ncbi:uncharacterized protein BDW43DRAFT_241850 [Aspergillus alliaceus]|uniref:uncharacterized protein n=1 Tax=Petromyces alliaceus TaxID=209559 RepID=UPI0012A3C30D|nr:uncharacterized protein BDW43DRAFT_241850 [Aspergillus alliaceus]KAB8236667.1 hypothetical protein BDW43DRAFT_241850 [Aspergillus alliaceus]